MTAVRYKEIGISVVNVLLSFLFFISLAATLAASPYHIALIVASAILAILWVIVTALSLALVDHWAATLGTCLGAGAAAFVASGASWGAIGGGLLLIILCGAARRTFIRNRHRYRHYVTADMFWAGMKLLVTGIVLASAGFALPFIQGSLARDGIHISPQQTELFLRPLAPLLEDLMPNIEVDSSVDEIIDEQLRQQGMNPQELTAEDRLYARQQISERLMVPVSSGETSLSHIVADRLNATFNQITQTHALTVAIMAVILVFLTLRAFIPFLTGLLLAVLIGVVWVAKKSGLVTIKKESVEVETLTLEHE